MGSKHIYDVDTQINNSTNNVSTKSVAMGYAVSTTIYCGIQAQTLIWLSTREPTWNRDARQRTAAGMQIVQEYAKRVCIELDNAELGLRQFRPIHLLGISAHWQSGQTRVGGLFIFFARASTIFVCKVKIMLDVLFKI